jgi:hypothetical protein
VRRAVSAGVALALVVASPAWAGGGARIARKGRHAAPGVSAYAHIYVVREATPRATAPSRPAALAGAPAPTLVASAARERGRGSYGPRPCLRRKFGGSVGSLLSLCVSRRAVPARRGPGSRPPRLDPEAVARILADRALARAPQPRIEVAPGAVGLAGLEAFFWVPEPRPVVASAAVRGLSVTAQARVVRYSWSFGDGAELVTSGAGRPWHRTRPGSVRHTYQAGGLYDISVAEIWEARWRAGRRPWRRLGSFSTVGARSYPVRQVVALLVPRR